MRKAMSFVLAAALVVPAWSATAAVGSTSSMSVATADGAQRTPSVSGDTIVWADERNGDEDIWLYDLRTGVTRPVSSAAGKQALPSIDGTAIVAEDYRGGNSNLYLYGLDGTERGIQLGSLVDRYEPDVSGSRIAWNDARSGNDDIYVYDLVSQVETAVVTDGYAQVEPAISDNWVVWTDKRKSAGANGDIYGFKFSTGTSQPICTDDAEQSNPDVDATMVVWQDYRAGEWDIFARSVAVGGVETSVCVAPGDQIMPRISGTRVVWQDDRNGDWDIYAFDIATGTETPVFVGAGDQTMPVISGDWVVWQDESLDAADIRAASLVPQPDLSASSMTAASSVAIGVPLKVAATIANAGAGVAPATSAGVYLSTDAHVDVNDVRIGSIPTPTLGVGSSLTVSGYVSVPRTLAPGTYKLAVVADATGLCTEYAEYDNAAPAMTLTVTRPTNDSFSSATTLSGASGRKVGYSYASTRQSGEPKHSGIIGGGSIWYKWTAPDTGRATIDLAGSSFDTVLAVYKGSSVGSLTRVASNDDVGARLQSRLTFSAVKGTTYRIAIDGADASQGKVALAWTNKATLARPYAPTTVKKNAKFTVTGSIKPRHKAGTKPIKLLRYHREGGKWVRRGAVIYVSVYNYSNYSRYKKSVTLPYKGAWRIYAQHADAGHATTTSSYRSVTVR